MCHVTSLDVAPPRPDAAVDRWIGPLKTRVAKMSRTFALAFFTIAILGTLFVVLLAVTTPTSAEFGVREGATAAAAIFFFVGLLPGLAIRRILRRDLRVATDLIKRGSAHHGQVTRCARLDGLHVVDVTWHDGDRDAVARFDVEKIDRELPIGTGIVVLARPRGRSVAAVFGEDGLSVGRRRRV
jgi:hypothetical protein